MSLQKLYEDLLTLRPQIDEKLKDVSFENIKELALWLAKSESYKKLKLKDNQIIMLGVFCDIWIKEKKKLSQIGVEDDIFYGVNSLASLEKKYQTIQFGLLRLETPMPEEYYEQAVEQMIKYRVSGIALYKILMSDTEQRKKNINKLSVILKNKGCIVTAIYLLQEAREGFPGDKDILMELADCWLAGGQLEQAYQCLMEIRKPDGQTKKLIQEMKEAIECEKAE